MRFYNLERKHTGLVKELKLKTPIDAIKYWRKIKPELFCNKTKDFELNFVNCYKNNYYEKGTTLGKIANINNKSV